MKETNLTRNHSAAINRGMVDTDARSYSWVEDMDNDTGADIPEGSVVVVVADGTIELAATVNEPRPTGVALDTIDSGDSGQVAFGGPVDLVLVTGSVTAGTYGQTSTTPGQAQTAPGHATAFCEFTASGTTPSAFLWGGRGGGGLAIASNSGVYIEQLDTAETDATLFLHPDGAGGVEWTAGSSGTFVQVNNGGEEMVASLGNLGSTETIDLATGNWQRGTLNADCTFAFTGATNGVGCSFTLFLTEDGTGGWEPTWPGSVVWIGGTTPTHDTTASSTSIYVFLSYDGGTTWYGAQAGGGAGGTTATDANIWRPLLDGSGAVVADGSGQAVMAWGPA